MRQLHVVLVTGLAQAVTERVDEIGRGDQTRMGELEIAANRRGGL
jgi:hypothetical protein